MSTGFQGIKYDEISALIKSEVGSIASSLSGKRSGVQEFTSNGTFTVPSGVYVIRVTACAAGENGTSGTRARDGSGSKYTKMSGLGGMGGNGGGNTFLYPISVTPGQSISITVGTGNTVIGNYLTLLKGGGMLGGSGGIQAWEYYYNDNLETKTPAVAGSDGMSSGFYPGGFRGSNTTNVLMGIHRAEIFGIGGGGGGASILGVGGKGGNGSTYNSVNNGGTGKGYGGGSGVGSHQSSAVAGSGGSGAPGKVIIEW